MGRVKVLSMLKQLIKFAQQHWLIVCIVIVATWLRTAELSTHAIFFGDAGRDLLVAANSVETGTLPLLGIPSSLPRFHQGPLTIWLEMLVFLMFGYNLWPYSLVFAMVSLAAVIGIYELATVYSSRRHGQIAALLLAASPLAVAHGRMVYHTNPIPLATVLYLWSLLRLDQMKPRSVFWAVLAWCFLFQFELAVVPVVMMIPYLIWRQGQRLNRRIFLEALVGFLVGLVPQIIHDLTHGFTQLGGFGIWIGYRLVSAFSIFGEHAVSPSTIGQTLTQFKLYGLRIVSLDQPVVGVIFAVVISWSLVLAWSHWKLKKLSPLMEVTWLSTLLLSLGFAIHSSPSEAYFPIFCVLVPLLVGFPLAAVSEKFQLFVWLGLGVWAVLMIVSISRNGWFVGQSGGFSYGPGVHEQRSIVNLVRYLTENDFRFTNTQASGQIPAHFDNLRWMAKEVGVDESPNGIPVYVEPKDSELTSYPTARKIEFKTLDVYTYE
jgi:4-amino-4-deoxy-L-arabinose transferase-like glycosyltransferase